MIKMASTHFELHLNGGAVVDLDVSFSNMSNYVTVPQQDSYTVEVFTNNMVRTRTS